MVFSRHNEKPFPERQEPDSLLNTEPFCGICPLLVFCKDNEIFAVQFIPGLDKGRPSFVQVNLERQHKPESVH
ncbi:MAG: hypothetical protein MUO95_08610 [Methanoregula sp.]|nr:hypothetical protein [Methanoregula sp.]